MLGGYVYGTIAKKLASFENARAPLPDRLVPTCLFSASRNISTRR
jgi:hypothetical protein